MSQPGSSPSIQSLERADLVRLKEFTDREIGAGYYSTNELEDIYERSRASGPHGEDVMCSRILKDGDEILGVRFTFPPGRWNKGKGSGLNVTKWPHSLDRTGYFQSLFLSDKVQGQGWGAKLSLASIESLREIGARGVVCHSWKESPNNSSTKYLEKMGFERVAEHPLYWKDVDYCCTRCLKPPCQCTAIEMYYEIPSANAQGRSSL